MFARLPLLRCLIALVVWQVPLCAIAQDPNPPPGWEFVRDLDSLRVDEFHAVGDTIFMYGYDYRVAVKREFKLVSYDGGVNWDSVVIPQSINPSLIYQRGFFPNDAQIWLSNIVDSSRTFYISRDGKNYETISIGKDTTRDMWQMEKFFIDPHDPNHWLHIGINQLSTSKSSLLTQSFDGGRNWQGVQLPPVPNRPIEKLSLELVFDTRRAHTWYLKVIGQVHFPPNDDTAIVYRTTNNGDSYTPVNQWGTHYGIGYPGEVRRWWGSPNQGLYGSLTGPDISENLQSYNWVQMFHPSLPLPGTKWGYGRELINSKILFDSRFPIYQPSTYLFFKANPHASVIIELEYEWDTITNKSISVRSWIHQTDDDWKTWHTIWESGRFEWADQIFLDEKSPSLWAITKFRSDTSFVGYNADRYTSFLYKHAIKLSVNPTYNSLPTAPLRVFPTPTNGPLKILLQIHNSHIISLQLSNAEGKIFAQTTNNFLFSEDIIEWSVPEYVPSGLYFVTIRTDNSIYLVKLILQR